MGDTTTFADLFKDMTLNDVAKAMINEEISRNAPDLINFDPNDGNNFNDDPDPDPFLVPNALVGNVYQSHMQGVHDVK